MERHGAVRRVRTSGRRGRHARRVTAPHKSDRLAHDAETTAYFVACEALTNAIKHSFATRVALDAAHRDGRLVVRVSDDGVGGATQQRGSGLRGLADRLAALGGTLAINSGHGGTTITASIPCAS